MARRERVEEYKEIEMERKRKSQQILKKGMVVREGLRN